MIPHWSFNASRSEQPEFEERVVESLHTYYSSRPSPRSGRVLDSWFRAFPNYWRGFVHDPGVLQNGVTRITRERTPEARWHYDVFQSNDSSGEFQRAQFVTTDTDLRTMHGEWRVDTGNALPDTWDRFSAICRLILNGGRSADAETPGSAIPHLSVTINECTARVAVPDASAPMTCSFALFDIVGHVASGSYTGALNDAFIVLDDMLSPLGPCFFCRAGEISFAPAGVLRGVCVFGRGYPPTYWWVDEAGQTVLVASTWKTLVASAPVDGIDGVSP